MRARGAAFAVVFGLGVLAAVPTQAQYFGQNEVQYRDFDFQILKTEHFDVYYYPEEKQTAELVGRLGERWYERYSVLFHHKMKDRQPVMLYASPADFRQTNVVQGLGEGTGGVTEGIKRRIVLPSAGAVAETNHVLGHELVHAFQYDINSRGGRQMQGGGNFYRLPLWFVEGQAEYLSLGPVDSQTAMWLRDAVQSKKLPTLKQLGNPRFFPYRFGHAFWAYVGGRWGDEKGIALFREGSRTGDAIGAIKKVLGLDEKTFSKEWDDSVKATYAGFLESRKAPATYGPLVIGKKHGGGELNLGPALSPDGKQLVFLSERDLFSIDLFLADAQTGKVIRKLTSTATDPHYDSLQFIESAGAWSPDGRRFVQSALLKGHAAFFVIDPQTGRRLAETEFKDLSELENPVFTPDGRRIVFSAMQGGLLDLWEYDLDTRQRTRLTNDTFAELQPAVSPDGRQVAFTTDRFTTNLDKLSFGPYRIAILDLATRSIREVPGYESARNSNPQWSPDGKTLFFLSDVTGGTDVHRVDLASGEIRQVTELRTGVYGITPLSPSLSVAHVSGRIAYTAREDGNHDIYAIDDPVKQAGVVIPAAKVAAYDRENAREVAEAAQGTVPAGTVPASPAATAPAPGTAPAPAPGTAPAASSTVPPPGAAPGTSPVPEVPSTGGETSAAVPGTLNGGTAVLPPYRRVASRVEQYLEDPNTGLPSTSAPEKTEPYKAKLGLQYVGQPSIGIGVDRFGSYVGGSTSLYFSDMLGNHNLGIAVQSLGELRDIAGQVVYTNLTHRFDWAVGAEFIPYLYGGNLAVTYDPANQTYLQSYQLFRQTDSGIFGMGAYPFSRADRVEVQVTGRRFGFSEELRTEAYDAITGQFLGQQKQNVDTGYQPLYLGSVSGAFVHDTSVFGATSPILGSRARFEVTPTFGSKRMDDPTKNVQFTDVLADWRGYAMPFRPVTFALRALHYGRYGGGAEDPRFISVYLGYPELIRGYDNMSASECKPNASSQCPIFERLFGSRMLIGNAEVRAPLWGLFKGRLTYGPLPVELALFADAGVAWGSGDTLSLLGKEDVTNVSKRTLLTSVGAAVRVNVLGFLVATVSYARPFQRPGVGWVWQWSFAPGF